MRAPLVTTGWVDAAVVLTGLLTGAVHGAVAASLIGRPDSLLVLLAMPLGAIAGVILARACSRFIGPRSLTACCGVLVVVAAVLTTLTTSPTDLGLAGVGAGVFTVTTPQLARELAARSRNDRGSDPLPYFPMGIGAMLIVVVAAFALGVSAPLAVWPVVAALGLATALVWAPLPESPLWLARHRGVESAHASLVRLFGTLEAGLELDWVLMARDMAAEQRGLRRRDLSLPGVRRTVLAGLIVPIAREAPFAVAALLLVPAVVASRSPGRPAAVAFLAAGLVSVSVGLLVLWHRFGPHGYARILTGLSLGVVGTALVALITKTSGAPALASALAAVAVLAIAQFALAIPGCSGIVEPMVPPWLTSAQTAADQIGTVIARACSLALVGILLGHHPLATTATVLVLVEIAVLLLVTIGLPQALNRVR